MDFSVLFKKGRIRLPHYDDLNEIYDGEAENAYTTGAAGEKTALITAIDGLVDTFETTNDGLITTAGASNDTTVDNFQSANDALITAAKSAKDTTVDSFDTTVDGLISTAVSDMESYVDTNSSGDTITVGAAALKAAIAAIINAIAPDYTTLKSDLADDIDLIAPNYAGLKTDLDTNLTGIAPDYAGLKTDIAGEVNSGISTTINKTDVIAAMKAEFIAARDLFEVDSEVYFQYNDPRCKGSGRHAANQDPNADQSITTQIHCVSCDGFGKTNEQNTATSTWTISDNSIPAT